MEPKESEKAVDFERLRELDRYLSTLSHNEVLAEIRKARLATPWGPEMPDSTELLREDRNR